MTYWSECLKNEERYNADSDKPSWWNWPEKSHFDLGYKLRAVEDNLYHLPYFVGKLPSERDIFERCGAATYAIQNPDDEIISGLVYKHDKADSLITFTALNSNYRKVNTYSPPYDRDYQFYI